MSFQKKFLGESGAGQATSSFFSKLRHALHAQIKNTREKTAKNKTLRKATRFFALALLALIFFSSLALVTLLAWYARELPNPEELITRNIPQTTKIYDRTGTHLLYEIHGAEKRTLVKLSDIPQYSQDAVILLEDKTFYEHNGLSLKGILRIAINPVLCKVTKNRFCAPGGSTISQQLVRNAILTTDRTLSRKLKEILLTLEVERRYSKDQILQMYFNEIPYGSMNFGIEAAAQSYFHKSASELSIAEAATLAALPRAPSTYLNHLDQLKARRDYAIDLLRQHGKITKEQADEAMKSDIQIAQKTVSNIEAPHFVFYVKERLTASYGERAVEEGGLKVITTLDYDMQKIAEEEVKNGVDTNGTRYNFNNASLVAIDPRTGQVLAMVGSRDYWNKDIKGQVNVATSPYRQPGSSFKPIVYAAAFAKGYTPDTVLWDVETTFPNRPQAYTPHNYDLRERGPVTLRKALQGSLNIPAVKLLYLVGLDRTLEFAHELGYTTLTDSSKVGLSLVLGGGSVRLVEHVNAYATFANDGVSHTLSSVLHVEKPSGEVLYAWNDEPHRVVDENIARTLSNVLSDNAARAYVFGANSALVLPDRPVAAKTGTTNDYKDAWTVGYTPSLAAGVWAGNTDNTAMNKAGGNLAAAPIWNAFMRRVTKETVVESFTAPTPLPANKPVLQGYTVEVPPNADGTPGVQPTMTLADGTTISNYGLCTPATVDRVTGKLATEYTPTNFRETRFFCEAHEILHYLDKDDPLGPPPEKPDTDPMYQTWETSLATWLTAKGISLTLPPSDHDDVHTPAMRPIVSLLEPTASASFTSRSITFSASASAPRGTVTRVEFWIDDVKIGESHSAPFTYTGFIPNRIPRGQHTARVIAFDDIDNSGEASTSIMLQADIAPISIDITSPASGSSVSSAAFPLSFTVQSGGPLQALDLFVAKNGGEASLVGTQFAPQSTQIVTWAAASGSGTYTIKVRGREEGDVFHWSSPITLHVR